MINVLSKKFSRKTKSFDLVMPFEFDESKQINVTKLSMQLLNFRGRIFALFMVYLKMSGRAWKAPPGKTQAH
jgi:hypothetical protein